MSGIVDASGKPVGRALTDQQIMQAFAALKSQIDQVTQQQAQLGLFVQYLYEHVARATNEAGDPVVPIDMSQFEEWANKEFEAIKAQADEMRKAAEAAQAEVNLEG